MKVECFTYLMAAVGVSQYVCQNMLSNTFKEQQYISTLLSRQHVHLQQISLMLSWTSDPILPPTLHGVRAE
jgi:hypothetical protein